MGSEYIFARPGRLLKKNTLTPFSKKFSDSVFAEDMNNG